MGSSTSSSDRTPDTDKRSGHGYTDVTIQHDARAHLGDSIHNGDIVYVTCERFYGSVHEQSELESPEGSASSSDRSLIKRKRSIHDSGGRSNQRQQLDLAAALGRLGKFSNSIKDQKLGKDARKIARHLRVLLDALQHDTSAPEHAQQEWDALKKCVVVADRVTINAASPRTARTNVVKVDRKKDVIRFGQWQISLTTTIFHSRDALGREVTETDSRIRVEPSTNLVGPSIAIFVGERTDFFGNSFLHPTVFAYRNVDSSSKVFELIKKDDIDGLKSLLAVQGATTRDCDAENRSLLFVSDFQ